MTIQAVLFDLDNTLTHRDQSVQAYSRQLFEVFRSNFYRDDIQNIDLITEIVRRIDNGGYPQKEFLTHPSIAASVAQALLTSLEWKQAPRLDDLTEYWFENFGLAAVPMQGAQSLLEYLSKNQYKLAVISNGGHATRLKILQGLGFTDYFHEIFTSESVGISKPHAQIFRHACQQLGVQVEQSLYVGDHPINDYQGASQAGLKALWLEGFHTLDSKQPPMISNKIQTLSELLNYLKE